MPQKYFLYARKSTDTEERQVKSIESQIAEVRQFAEYHHISIRRTFKEAQTAKVPGRPIFNEMLDRIEKGEAAGIVAWHPDRLARNSMDGGRIVHLLDTNKLHDLKFPSFWFDNTPQGKFVLSIAFGQSKYYIDNLSENVKRGCRQAVRRGDWPFRSPLGYFRNPVLKKQVIDPVSGPILKRLFEMYATGDYVLADLVKEARALGYRSKTGQIAVKSVIHRILTNPFYYGHMRHDGELFQGKHEPLISKHIFDQVGKHLRCTFRPNKYKKKYFAYTGLAHCGSCGCSITAEKQKGCNYYHCTKKREKCPERYLREELLEEQITNAIRRIAIPVEQVRQTLTHWCRSKFGSTSEGQKELKEKIMELESKIARLLDAYLDGVIEKDLMCSKQEALMSKKATLQEKLNQIERDHTAWMEPLEDCLEISQQAVELLQGEPKQDQLKALIRKIGTNFKITHRKLYFDYLEPWSLLVQQNA